MEKTLIGQATPDQIQKWKADHEKVFTYTVDGRIAYLKPVDRNTYSAAMAKIATSPAKFTEKIIEGIWLGGDDAIKKEEAYWFGLVDFTEELMNKKKGELGEL